MANDCPIISRNTIVKNSTSLAEIWQTIRLHFGFQSSGANFLDFNDIRLQDDEEPEDLYQRLVAFLEDLLKHDGTDVWWVPKDKNVFRNGWFNHEQMSDYLVSKCLFGLPLSPCINNHFPYCPRKDIQTMKTCLSMGQFRKAWGSSGSFPERVT